MAFPQDVLLLHGALGASSQLEPLAREFGGPFRPHVMDFEGHGATAARSRPFRMEHFVENVVEHLDRERLASVNVFGYSMGGYVALLLAAQCPDRVARVATLGTKFQWDPVTAQREARRLDPAAIRARVPAFADALAARHATAGGWERVLAATAEMLLDLGERPRLNEMIFARIMQPVRVFVGERDNTVSEEESTAAASTLGDGEVILLRDTPHPIEQVDVATLASLLLTFFH